MSETNNRTKNAKFGVFEYVDKEGHSHRTTQPVKEEDLLLQYVDLIEKYGIQNVKVLMVDISEYDVTQHIMQVLKKQLEELAEKDKQPEVQN